MSEEKCTHSCETCGVSDCAARNKIEKLKPNPNSKIGKTIAVMSGKGGVGKSMVTSLLAVSLMKEGKKVGILDADVTGPSIPKAFGQNGYQAYGDENGIFPAITAHGIKLLSANNLLDDPSKPIIWRGSLISNLVSQMYTMCIFDELDVLLIDMPPGTGDVPLIVFQQIPIDGAIFVTSPQDLVGDVVAKSIEMAKEMNIKIVGLIENMAYVKCPHCEEKIHLFGENTGSDTAKRLGIPFLAELPIDPTLSKLIDEGKIEVFQGDYLTKTLSIILQS